MLTMKTELLKELRKKFAEYYKIVIPSPSKYKYAIIYRGTVGGEVVVMDVPDSDRCKCCLTSDLDELKLMVRRLAHEFMKRKIKALREDELSRKFLYPW